MVAAPASGENVADTFAAQLRADFGHHYSRRPLTNVALGFGITGVLANTNFDQEVQDIFRDDLQGDLGEDLTNFFTDVGDVAQPIPAVAIYAGAMLLGRTGAQADSGVARWGSSSLRAMLIGAPQLYVLANISGGQRPEEGEAGWDPFDDDNGVSGHAFFGALPIMTAAKMTEKRWLRRTLVGLSVMPALARIYDDKHYASQAFMGWWLARASTRTVDLTNRRTHRGSERRLTFEPVLFEDAVGLGVAARFR